MKDNFNILMKFYSKFHHRNVKAMKRGQVIPKHKSSKLASFVQYRLTEIDSIAASSLAGGINSINNIPSEFTSSLRGRLSWIWLFDVTRPNQPFVFSERTPQVPCIDANTPWLHDAFSTTLEARRKRYEIHLKELLRDLVSIDGETVSSGINNMIIVIVSMSVWLVTEDGRLYPLLKWNRSAAR